MAYGFYNPYPPAYQPPFGEPQQMRQPYTLPAIAPQNADERVWVQGENAAAAYLVAPNGFVRLWDSTTPVFYEKRADASGKPLPMEIYEYKRKGGAPAPVEPSTDILARYAALEQRVAALEKGGITDDAE